MWYYAAGSKVDLETWPSDEVFYLYNSAEENMDKGMQIWEQAELWQRNPSKQDSCEIHLEKLGLDGLFNDMTADEAAERTENMRSQINLLWGRMLYECSIVEFNLGLEIAIEKFECAGAAPTDIAIMVKNYCSNDTSVEGVSFKLDEARKWQGGVCSFRLEPLFHRRTYGLHHTLEKS